MTGAHARIVAATYRQGLTFRRLGWPRMDMKLGQECFVVRDAEGHAVAYVYFQRGAGAVRRARAAALGQIVTSLLHPSALGPCDRTRIFRFLVFPSTTLSDLRVRRVGRLAYRKGGEYEVLFCNREASVPRQAHFSMGVLTRACRDKPVLPHHRSWPWDAGGISLVQRNQRPACLPAFY
jgi:hypothetical protein